MQPVIEVKNLCKQFRTVTAVDDLSFTVNDGDIYGFLGQNGAGKSTTIRMLLTLVQPTAGTIKLFDQQLSNGNRKALANVGAVIEKPDVYKYLSAYNNLRLFARLSGCSPSQKELMQQLEMVGLAARAHDAVKTFSQGMKQRLGIAIALIHNPQLIILDEPTNGLDPQGIADIRNLILHLGREMKKTILISSHLLSEIEQVATKLLIIDKGKKLIEGNTKELFNPEETIVELDTNNNTEAAAKISNSAWQQKMLVAGNNRLRFKMHLKDVPAFNIWLVQNDIPVLNLESRHSLEDYFLQITNGKQYVEPVAN